MKKKINIFVSISLILFSGTIYAQNMNSDYTDIKTKKEKNNNDLRKESGSFPDLIQKCRDKEDIKENPHYVIKMSQDKSRKLNKQEKKFMACLLR